MRLSPFEAYCMFQALKLHFTSDTYDYFKYNGKVKTTVDQFNMKRDKYFYHRLCRRYDRDQIQDFLLANMLAGDPKWVGNFLDDEADAHYKQHMRHMQSLTYEFKNELQDLFDSVSDLADLFKMESNGYPKLFNEHMNGTISRETAMIIDDVTQCFSKFDSKLNGDFLWDKFYFKCRKYRPFLSYDKEKIKTILKEQLNSLDRQRVAC